MLRGLSQYRVIARLAQGGQSEIFLALDARLNRRVCIKLYTFEDGLGERRRVESEAWRLASVDSPHILKVLDVVAHRQRLALVTPYVPGCSLDSLLEEQSILAPEEALAVTTELARGLAALRTAGLVHGDLSPRNILIDTAGRVVIADFGSALRPGQRAQSLSDLASSPEQLQGEPVTLASDFFALGLLLYRMLTGSHPFTRDGQLEPAALRQGLRDTRALEALSPNIREPMKTLLHSLLAKEPGRRPKSTYELRERLRALRSLLPPPAGLAAQARALQPRDLTRQGDESLSLPLHLVRLPWQRQLGAALNRYWQRGTSGSRALLVAALCSPLALVLLLLVQPGPCIEVRVPRNALGEQGFPAASGYGELHSLVTEMLKRDNRGAQVLGAGDSSDSIFELSPVGIKNVCTPRRHVDVSVECLEETCALELVGRFDDRIRRSRISLPRLSSDRELRVAVAQLVGEQRAVLH